MVSGAPLRVGLQSADERVPAHSVHLRAQLLLQVLGGQRGIPVLFTDLAIFLLISRSVQTWHAPIGCALLKVWLKQCNDDSETFNWISAYTKDCPKCKVNYFLEFAQFPHLTYIFTPYSFIKILSDGHREERRLQSHELPDDFLQA